VAKMVLGHRFIERSITCVNIAFRRSASPLVFYLWAGWQLRVRCPLVKMQMSELDVKGYAEKLGVPHQTIYAILTGSRLPSKLLKKLGLEVVYRIMPESGNSSDKR
jgi:hypothetical protein